MKCENTSNVGGAYGVLRLVDQCWDSRIADNLLEKARDESLTPKLRADLLEELVIHGQKEATDYARSLLTRRDTDPGRQLARQVAVVLWLTTDGWAMDVVLPEFLMDKAFFRDVVADVIRPVRWARVQPTPPTESQVAELFILLCREFPQNEEEEEDDEKEQGTSVWRGSGGVTDLRNNLLSILRDAGTSSACAAIERIKVELPELAYLDWVLRAARRRRLEATWKPLTIKQLRELIERPHSRLVRNGRELQQVILESFSRIQDRLHDELPAVRDLWDYNRESITWEPVDEDDLSNYLARQLKMELEQSGIVALREVQIRPTTATEGQRTDIYVAAVVVDIDLQKIEQCRVIIEVKGCWHPDVQTAMQTQLKDRYLHDNACSHGVYVVGWFMCVLEQS